MSVSLIGEGDEPLIYYTDPMRLLTHMNEVHGVEVVIGMAELMAWSAGADPGPGRFEAGTLPKTLDEMYACATNEVERSSITEMLFGSRHRRAGPLPAGQAEARRAARHARLPGRQLDLPRAGDARAARPGWRSGWPCPTRTPC